MGLVIDTSALVAIERRAPEARGAIAWAEVLAQLASEPVVLPAVVLAEVLVGVAMADTAMRAAVRRSRIDALVAHVPVVDFDAAIAEEWARLFARPTSGILSRSMVCGWRFSVAESLDLVR